LVKYDSPDTYVVGIDDTDMPDIGGTGRLSRRLVAEIEALRLARSQGGTRHQFFEGPGVPKTVRNSAAAVALDGVTSVSVLFETACGIVARESIDGSDPGVAMGKAPVSAELVEFGRRAQTGLVAQTEARRLGSDHDIRLVGLGGTEDGVIGALGAMALRLAGNDGRFVDLPGIRQVAGVMTVADVLSQTAIADVVDADVGESLAPANHVDLGDWVRPRLMDGRPVLVARLHEERWVNADSRSNK
jgi:hypothetical protein